MKIDLNYLNRFGKLEINSDFVIDESYYKNTDIRKLENLHVSGEVSVDYEDDINFNLNISGRMILPCAVSLVDVPYDFDTNIEENIGKFEEIYKKIKIHLKYQRFYGRILYWKFPFVLCLKI